MKRTDERKVEKAIVELTNATSFSLDPEEVLYNNGVSTDLWVEYLSGGGIRSDVARRSYNNYYNKHKNPEVPEATPEVAAEADPDGLQKVFDWIKDNPDAMYSKEGLKDLVSKIYLSGVGRKLQDMSLNSGVDHTAGILRETKTLHDMFGEKEEAARIIPQLNIVVADVDDLDTAHFIANIGRYKDNKKKGRWVFIDVEEEDEWKAFKAQHRS